MTMLSAVLFLVGLIQLRANPNVWNQVPESILQIALGAISFGFFFPWFLVMYFSRYFLLELQRLEQEIYQLRESLDERDSGD